MGETLILWINGSPCSQQEVFGYQLTLQLALSDPVAEIPAGTLAGIKLINHANRKPPSAAGHGSRERIGSTQESTCPAGPLPMRGAGSHQHSAGCTLGKLVPMTQRQEDEVPHCIVIDQQKDADTGAALPSLLCLTDENSNNKAWTLCALVTGLPCN